MPYKHYTERLCYQNDLICKGCKQSFRGRKRRKYCTHLCALKSGVKRGWSKPGREAILSPSINEIYWAAGVYEGEGSGRLHGRSFATISQKDRWLLDKIKDLFGGVIKYRERAGASKKPIFQWSITGSRSRGFLLTILVLLSPKRQFQILRTQEV